MSLTRINEAEAELIIEQHLREQGWDIIAFTMTRKRWREGLDGEEADRVFLHGGKVVAILEAKKPGKDLWAALKQAKAMHGLIRRTPVATFLFSLRAMVIPICAKI